MSVVAVFGSLASVSSCTSGFPFVVKGMPEFVGDHHYQLYIALPERRFYLFMTGEVTVDGEVTGSGHLLHQALAVAVTAFVQHGYLHMMNFVGDGKTEQDDEHHAASRKGSAGCAYRGKCGNILF